MLITAGGGGEGERHQEEQEKEACPKSPRRAGRPAQGASVPEARRPGPPWGRTGLLSAHPRHTRDLPRGLRAPGLMSGSTLLASRETEMGEGGEEEQEQRARGPGEQNTALSLWAAGK